MHKKVSSVNKAILSLNIQLQSISVGLPPKILNVCSQRLSYSTYRNLLFSLTVYLVRINVCMFIICQRCMFKINFMIIGIMWIICRLLCLLIVAFLLCHLCFRIFFVSAISCCTITSIFFFSFWYLYHSDLYVFAMCV